MWRKGIVVHRTLKVDLGEHDDTTRLKWFLVARSSSPAWNYPLLQDRHTFRDDIVLPSNIRLPPIYLYSYLATIS